MQTQVHRRFSNPLTLGGSCTWSQAMKPAEENENAISQRTSLRCFRTKVGPLKSRFRQRAERPYPQVSGVDNPAGFDPAGNQANSRLGQYIAAREARRVQLALKPYF